MQMRPWLQTLADVSLSFRVFVWKTPAPHRINHENVTFGVFLGSIRRVHGRDSMSSPCYTVAMDVGVCQLRSFSISFLSSVLSSSSVSLENSSSGASVVAIDNKIEQAMDLVKSHLMYAVREEVEVLKEQIKELVEKNSQLEQENTLLKNLASPEQLAQFQAQVQSGSPTSGAAPALTPNPGPGATA
ncbi:TSC22 domain family protein 1 isoform X2 [Pimephales promelas]|uniref:TSC22 domain family protein 1 isoform X2 n=1 Tax=Pimephales promelas TaxID=90988 RepID=UPI0019559ED5|nr:TSC22 domain family protein 1 isoform X2 [Pimephales promelas]